MTHHDAQREMSVERYLLGELEGDARDEFENHLFDCALCGADLQAGADLTEGIRSTGPQLVSLPARKAVPTETWKSKASTWAASLLQPWIAVPALAACLGIIGVQSFVVQPRLHRELAEAEAPSVVSNVRLAGESTRSVGMSEVLARPGGGFLLSVDISSDPRYRGYRCTLVSPSGQSVWHTDLSPAQVNNPVVIHVPADSTTPGVNVLKVEGLPEAGTGAAVPLFQRSFNLKIGE